MTDTNETQVEVTLKPCPFCGSEETSHGWEAPGIDGSASTGIVQCHDCNALIYAEPGEAEAIEAWNTRIQAEKRNNALAVALDKAAARLNICAGYIEDFPASGTLRAQRAMKARHMALEAKAALEGDE